MKKYYPEGALDDQSNAYGYNVAILMTQVLKQCGNDLSRENIMKQAANIKDFELPLLLPGIKVNTSPTDFAPIEQEQLAKFDGEKWALFGEIFDAFRKQVAGRTGKTRPAGGDPRRSFVARIRLLALDGGRDRSGSGRRETARPGGLPSRRTLTPVAAAAAHRPGGLALTGTSPARRSRSRRGALPPSVAIGLSGAARRARRRPAPACPSSGRHSPSGPKPPGHRRCRCLPARQRAASRGRWPR